VGDWGGTKWGLVQQFSIYEKNVKTTLESNKSYTHLEGATGSLVADL